MIDLQMIWFLLVGVLVIGYAVLDGFDLGVGMLHLFAKDETERRTNFNACGPVWDGNEVWLLTGGGALFAAFPIVYATVFSGFYLALMLLLAALIFRAVSFEFRSKVDSPSVKKIWDTAFGVSSFLIALLLSVAFGNILGGVPVTSSGVYTGTFFGLLNPYAVIIGLLGVVMFVMHGAIYLAMKSEGAHSLRMARWANGAWMAFIVLYLVATLATFFYAHYLFDGMLKNPLFWVLFVLLLGSIGMIPLALKSGRFGRAFTASSAVIASVIGLSAVSLFPRLVPSSIDLANSLTVYNASSSTYTLTAMLIIALIGVPIVLGYTIFMYRVFKGKVVLGPDSY
ncbi:MAG TPA: cytochrome d ubiquinol oxidase subunit II [Bacteroidota bacterium]|nr:cytochrome d ubiquinol oxidase subunit II [Bacteroidota bacterium]